MNRFIQCSFIIALACFVSIAAHAQDDSYCFLNKAASSAADTTLGEITEYCRKQALSPHLPARLLKEKLTENNEFVITPHKQNYLLPYTHNSNPNQAPYADQKLYPGVANPVQYKEAKLQISLKIPLTHRDLLTENDGLYFGFTLKSFWQVYNHQLSAPFRETNYQPEIFYQAPIRSDYLDGTWFARVGFEHESNGKSHLFSRSWNRIYAGIGFQKRNWAIYVQPWYRIPEKAKLDDNNPSTPPLPKGDDNPNIEDYLGNYEITGVVDWGRYVFTTVIKQNFDTGYGAVETGLSFPLWGRLKGYVQFYNGYGESLIDYDHRAQRVGLGILLTDFL